MNPLAIGVAVVQLGWGLLIASSIERPLLASYVAACRSDWRRALAGSLFLSFVAGLVATLAWLVGTELRESAGTRIAGAWAYVPAAVLLWPLVLLVVPQSYSWSLPGDLRRAGAPKSVVVATCVVAFPVSVTLLGLFAAGYFLTFTDLG